LNNNTQINTEKKLTGKSPTSHRFFEPSVQNNFIYCDFEELLKRKQLNANLFKKDPKLTLTVDSDIAEHAKWVFNNIYSVGYPNSKNQKKIRPAHGIQHVCRAALLVPVFANLNRKHGDKEAANLSAYDLKLLQIAALFHDSAREDDGVDRWDHESAMLLYKYLTSVLGVNATKAKQITESVANKEPNPANGQFEIIEPEQGKIAWRYKIPSTEPTARNIYQELLHDADCLDIIRARLNFEADRLYFYKNIVANGKGSGLNEAFEELAQLLVEARSLIHHQGDSYMMLDYEVKRLYENEQAYSLLNKLVDKVQHKLIYQLKNGLLDVENLIKTKLVDLTAFDPRQGLTEGNLRAAMREGLLLARGIEDPSANCTKNRQETLGQVEVRKASREAGIKTATAKADNQTKFGSPFRSASVIGYGSGVFSNAGFLILNPKSANFWDVSAIDVDSGHAKKEHFKKRIVAKPSLEIIQQLRANLLRTMKLGGKGRYFDKLCFPARHTEIQYDVTSYDAIYFTNDPTLHNTNVLRSYASFHPLSSILQSLYLRKQYETQMVVTKKKFCQQFGVEAGATQFVARFGQSTTLPLFEYSGMHNQINAIPESDLTDDKIIQMWITITSDFMRKELAKLNGIDIEEISNRDLKILAVYGRRTDLAGQALQPADASYSPQLREAIGNNIERNRKKILADFRTKQLKDLRAGKLSPLSYQVVGTILKHKSFAIAFYKQLVVAIEAKLKSGDLFQQSDSEGSPSFINALTGFCDWRDLPVDSKNFIKEKAHTYRVFRAIEELKLLTLCARFELEDFKNTLNNLANSYVVSALKNLAKESMDNHTHSTLDTFEKVILLFNLSGECMDEMEKVKQKLFDYKMQEYLNHNCRLQYYLHFIQKYQSAGWLTPDQKKGIEAVCETVRKKALCPDSTLIMAEIEAYLKLLEICGGDTKPYAKEWLQQSRLVITESVFLARLKNYADLEDEEIFCLVIDKVSSNQMHMLPGDFQDKCHPWFWLANVKVLKESLPNTCFSNSQLAVVQNTFNEVCDKYLADDDNSGECISDLLDRILMPLNELDPKLTVPDNYLAKFNAELTHSIAQVVIDNAEDIPAAKHLLSEILQAHERLGAKEGREESIQSLISKIRCAEGLDQQATLLGV